FCAVPCEGRRCRDCTCQRDISRGAEEGVTLSRAPDAVRREVPLRRAGADPAAACDVAFWVPALRRCAPRPGHKIYPNFHSAVSTTRSTKARTLAESRREVG